MVKFIVIFQFRSIHDILFGAGTSSIKICKGHTQPAQIDAMHCLTRRNVIIQTQELIYYIFFNINKHILSSRSIFKQ